jgi:hypothetical protein
MMYVRFVAPEWNRDDVSLDRDNTYDAWNWSPSVKRRVTLVSTPL